MTAVWPDSHLAAYPLLMPTKGFFGYALRDPDAPCLVDPQGTRTRGEVTRRVFRAANGLRELGLGKGDHVCLLVGNRSEFVELAVASGISGTILTAVNWHLKPDEAAYVVSDCDATVLFCDADFAEMGLEAAERAPAVRTVISVGGPLDGAVELEEWLDAQSPDEPADPITGGQMLYSSGTTGMPKGILRLPASDDVDTVLEASERPTGGRIPYITEGRWLVTGPLYHA
ncbi:MAG: AMP-binding protein, partial [Candidatus Binatia bacterium]